MAGVTGEQVADLVEDVVELGQVRADSGSAQPGHLRDVGLRRALGGCDAPDPRLADQHQLSVAGHAPLTRNGQLLGRRRLSCGRSDEFGERRGDPIERDGAGEEVRVTGLVSAPAAEEACQLRVDGPVTLRWLALQAPERLKLSLLGDDSFDAS